MQREGYKNPASPDFAIPRGFQRHRIVAGGTHYFLQQIHQVNPETDRHEKGVLRRHEAGGVLGVWPNGFWFINT